MGPMIDLESSESTPGGSGSVMVRMKSGYPVGSRGEDGGILREGKRSPIAKSAYVRLLLRKSSTHCSPHAGSTLDY